MKSKGQSFVGGAAVLMAAAVIVKIIGALFKIPLTRVLGGGGMGYFMTAYGFFNPIYALSVAGFPVAVSKLTAQSIALGRRHETASILAAALMTFPLVGLALSGVIFAGAGWFVGMVGNPQAYRSVLAIAPAIFFACVTAVFRGYFEGSRNMLPTAASQVAEALVKLVAGVFLAFRCADLGYAQYELDKIVFGVAVTTLEEAAAVIAPQAAAAAICGVSVSTAAGCVYMVLRCCADRGLPVGRRDDGAPWSGPARFVGPLLRYALPVCLGALVVNLTSLIDLASVMNRLSQAAQTDLSALAASHPDAGLGGMSAESLPNFLYGSYTGLAVTVFNLVPAITTPLGTSALPMISALYVKGQRPRLRLAIESVLRVTAAVAVPAGMGLCAMAEPSLRLLFSDNPAEVAVAVPLLQTLGISAILVAITAPISSMLQAIGKVYTPVRLMLMGGAVKLLVNWVLVAMPAVNIKGAPVGTLCCYLIILLGGARALARATDTNLNLAGIVGRPALAGLACCVAARLSYGLLCAKLDSLAMVLPAVSIGGICYIIMAYLLGIFDSNDVFLLPQGAKFAKLLAKRKRMG